MKKEINGKTYVQVPENIPWSCHGCVADGNKGLCHDLHADGTACNDQIWGEGKMNTQKTALELVDNIRDVYIVGRASAAEWQKMICDIKSAIEREQDAAEERYEKIFAESKRTRSLLDTLRKSAITMRPIFELPDNVPEGCVVVQCTPKWIAHWDWIGSVFRDSDATHFYVMPLPKPECKLHRCHIPGCGGEPFLDFSMSNDAWIACTKCGARGPVRKTIKDAEDAWGWE